MWFSPLRLILVGLFLVVLGAVLPWLMVLQLIPASFILSMISYLASTFGLVMGLIGAAMYARLYRKDIER